MEPLINIIELEKERLGWSMQTFPEATVLSALKKLEEEILEVKTHLYYHPIDIPEITEEYADCLMCLFDSAGRLGISTEDIFQAFKLKLDKNKKRKWVKNQDNTYSHQKG